MSVSCDNVSSSSSPPGVQTRKGKRELEVGGVGVTRNGKVVGQIKSSMVKIKNIGYECWHLYALGDRPISVAACLLDKNKAWLYINYDPKEGMSLYTKQEAVQQSGMVVVEWFIALANFVRVYKTHVTTMCVSDMVSVPFKDIAGVKISMNVLYRAFIYAALHLEDCGTYRKYGFTYEKEIEGEVHTVPWSITSYVYESAMLQLIKHSSYEISFAAALKQNGLPRAVRSLLETMMNHLLANEAYARDVFSVDEWKAIQSAPQVKSAIRDALIEKVCPEPLTATVDVETSTLFDAWIHNLLLIRDPKNVADARDETSMETLRSGRFDTNEAWQAHVHECLMGGPITHTCVQLVPGYALNVHHDAETGEYVIVLVRTVGWFTETVMQLSLTPHSGAYPHRVVHVDIWESEPNYDGYHSNGMSRIDMFRIICDIAFHLLKATELSYEEVKHRFHKDGDEHVVDGDQTYTVQQYMKYVEDTTIILKKIQPMNPQRLWYSNRPFPDFEAPKQFNFVEFHPGHCYADCVKREEEIVVLRIRLCPGYVKRMLGPDRSNTKVTEYTVFQLSIRVYEKLVVESVNYDTQFTISEVSTILQMQEIGFAKFAMDLVDCIARISYVQRVRLKNVSSLCARHPQYGNIISIGDQWVARILMKKTWDDLTPYSTYGYMWKCHDEEEFKNAYDTLTASLNEVWFGSRSAYKEFDRLRSDPIGQKNVLDTVCDKWKREHRIAFKTMQQYMVPMYKQFKRKLPEENRADESRPAKIVRKLTSKFVYPPRKLD